MLGGIADALASDVDLAFLLSLVLHLLVNSITQRFVMIFVLLDHWTKD